ncbi:MAG: abortive infection family protein [Microthrixaceae bacterium]
MADDDLRLTRKEIGRLVYNWIGVDGGYLGSFSYAKHDRFWLEVCDLSVGTAAYTGTTRECFERTLFQAAPRDQAAALRAILEDYPPLDAPDPDQPKFRTVKLNREILSWISRLETGTTSVEVALLSASESVQRALEDADNLMRTSGPQSAVDRVHTALHGYLLSLCDDAEIAHGDRPTMNQLFKALRREHPSLGSLGVRADDVAKMLGSMASILDALNPVRNNASMAHPTSSLVKEAEAVLVINTARTLLTYFDAKQRDMARSPHHTGGGAEPF